MNLSLKNLKLSRFSTIGMIVVGLALLLYVGMLLAGVFDAPTRIGEKKVDPNRCPHCNHPLTSYAKDKGECLFCKGKLTGKNDGALSQSGKVIPFVLVGAFCLLVIVNVAFFVRGRVKQKADDEDYYSFHCGKCRRKVRYRTRQMGQFARCPICRQLMRFPEAPEQPKGRWTRLKGWLKRSKKKPVEDPAR